MEKKREREREGERDLEKGEEGVTLLNFPPPRFWNLYSSLNSAGRFATKAAIPSF